MDRIDKSKKMSNEGHSAKVPHGGTIGLVFIIGIVVGCVVVFLAVAGRTEGVIQQRRVMLQEKNAKAAAAPAPADPSTAPETATSEAALPPATPETSNSPTAP